MPFQRPADPSPAIAGEADWWYPDAQQRRPSDPPPDIILRGAGPATFQLVRGFAYLHPSTQCEYEITKHRLDQPPTNSNNSTDFASVPSLFWWLIASYGHHTRAALIHDQLWDPQPRTPDSPNREDTNTIFRDALAESDVAFFRRWIMWAGVDAARRSSANIPLLLWLGAQVAVVGWFLVAAAFWGQPHLGDFASWLWAVIDSFGSTVLSPFSWIRDGWPSTLPLGSWHLPVALAAVGSVFWQYRWALAALGLGLVLPPLLPELVARGVLFVLDLIARPVHAGTDPTVPSPWPTLRPTRVRPML